MNTKILLGVIAVLAIIAAGYFGIVKPRQREKKIERFSAIAKAYKTATLERQKILAPQLVAAYENINGKGVAPSSASADISVVSAGVSVVISLCQGALAESSDTSLSREERAWAAYAFVLLGCENIIDLNAT